MKNNKVNSTKRKPWANYDRLKWSVQFADMCLSELSKKSLEKVRNDFMAFMRIEDTYRPATIGTVDPDEYFRPGGVIISCTSKRQPEKFTITEFKRLQKSVQRIIEEVVFRQEQREQSQKHSKLWLAQLARGRANASSVKEAYRVARKNYPVDPVEVSRPLPEFDIKVKFLPGIAMLGVGVNLIYANGPTHDMAVFNLLYLVATEKTERIIRCPNPKCGRIFTREGKRMYCDEQCSKVMTQKNWRGKTRRRK